MMINKKTIVMVESFPTDMLAKISYGFKNRGYETILITLTGNKNSKFLIEAYNKLITCDFKFFKMNIQNLFKIIFYSIKKNEELLKAYIEIRKIKPYIVISRANPNWLCYITKKYFYQYPVIYFPYDIRSDAYKNKKEAMLDRIPQFEINAEKKCYEYLDGIIHKGDEKELEQLNYNYLGKIPNIKCPKLHILPPTFKSLFCQNKKKISKKDKELHIVFVGGIGTSKSWIDSIQNVLKEKIHLHIYGKFANLTEKEEYERIKKYIELFNSPYFHLERRVDQSIITKEISKYDYGTWLVFEDYVSKFIKRGTGNKMATYLEAGLPIVCPKEYETICKILNKYKVGIGIDKKDLLSNILKKQNYKQLEKNIIKAREELSMETQIPRLEKFFEEVIEYHKNKK